MIEYEIRTYGDQFAIYLLVDGDNKGMKGICADLESAKRACHTLIDFKVDKLSEPWWDK